MFHVIFWRLLDHKNYIHTACTRIILVMVILDFDTLLSVAKVQIAISEKDDRHFHQFYVEFPTSGACVETWFSKFCILFG